MILDTDILKAFLTGSGNAYEKIQFFLSKGEELKTTVINAHELFQEFSKKSAVVSDFLRCITVLELDAKAAGLAKGLTRKELVEAIVESNNETIVSRQSYRCRTEKW